MGELNQDNRPLRVKLGSLDPTGYVITSCVGTEAMSQLYRFTLELAAPVDAPLPFEEVLGKLAVVAVDQSDAEARFFHGIVNRFSQGKRDERFIHYRAELVPLVWLLTRQVRSRTFQQKTVQEILTDVIGPVVAPRFTLDAQYFPRNFVVQYRESDFDFASRLMEEEGIYYYFTHTADAQELVISDTPRGHDPLPGDPKLVFLDESLANPTEGRVTRWEKAQELRAGLFGLTDHTFELPRNDLRTSATGIDKATAGTVEHPLMLGGMGSVGTQDYPGRYAIWRDGIAPGGGDRGADVPHVFEDNDRISGLRVEEEFSGVLRIDASSTFCRVTPGHKFTLTDHFDADGDYVVTTVRHAATCGLPQSDGDGLKYGNEFACIPFAVSFRPGRRTAKPFIRGTQTAVVIGSDDEEIEPDKFGRVKVLFRWDPDGARGLDTSCWVRVAQFWAGLTHGSWFLPRIGDEVVVTFLEGDPDQPLIVGSVYNADNMPMFDMPKSKTQSGLKTRSSPGGDPKNYNELMFEDKKGHELVSIHAERNMRTTVEASETVSVGANSTTNVGNNSTVVIGTDAKADPRTHGKSTTTVFGDTSSTVTKGDHKFTVETGESSSTVAGAVTAGYGDIWQVTAKLGIRLESETKSIVLVGAESIKLTSGESTLEMKKDGTITITGKVVTINGSQSVAVKPAEINVEGTNVKVSGAKVDVAASGITSISGAMVKINS